MKIEIKKKETKIKIQHNIPAPATYIDFPFEDMGIGDSFFAPVTVQQLNTAKWNFWRHKKKTHWKFVIRRENIGKVKGSRIWRTK